MNILAIFYTARHVIAHFSTAQTPPYIQAQLPMACDFFIHTGEATQKKQGECVALEMLYNY